MRVSSWLFVAAGAAVVLAGQTWGDEGAAVEMDGSVIVGTSSNIDDIISTSPFVLVEFYAPWCGHCKALAPEFAAAADTLADKGSPVKLMKVDAEKHDDLAQRFQIQGFPTLKWFAGDRPAIEFNGGRTAQDIVTWVTKKSGPNPVPLTSIEEADTARKDTPVSAVGFFSKQEGPEFDAYNRAAQLSEVVYYLVTDPDVAAHLKITDAPKVVFFQESTSEPMLTYNGEWDTKTLHEWCVGSSVPPVIEFNEKNVPKIFDGPLKKHLLVFLKKSSDKFDSLIETMKTAADSFKGRLLFIYVNTDGDENARVLEFFGLSSANVPATRIINMESGLTKYAPELEMELTVEALTSFGSKFLDGSLKPSLKSQALPDDWDAKPVKVLVSSNVDEVALNDSAHVLVELYAPWCGHCKQLAPIYDELGEAYEHDSSVVIAKLDATENELADISVESFPTIFFFPKGAKAKAKSTDVSELYKVYEGNRDLESFLQYLETETGVAGQRSGGDGGAAESTEEAPAATEEDVGSGHEEL